MLIKKFLKYGGNNNRRDILVSRVQAISGDNRVTQMAGELYDLLVLTTYLDDIVYQHVVNKKPYADVMEEYDMSRNALKVRIYREDQRVQRDLAIHKDKAKDKAKDTTKDTTKDITKDIVDYINKKEYNKDTTTSLIQIIRGLAELAEERHFEGDLIGKLNVKLDSYRYNKELDMDDLQFVEMINRLGALSRHYSEYILSQLPEDFVGHIKYLLGSDEKYLSKIDLERRRVIEQAWWLNEDD